MRSVSYILLCIYVNNTVKICEHQFDNADELTFEHKSKIFNSTNLVIEDDPIMESDEEERNCLDD
jgi:hypothetical protein